MTRPTIPRRLAHEEQEATAVCGRGAERRERGGRERGGRGELSRIATMGLRDVIARWASFGDKSFGDTARPRGGKQRLASAPNAPIEITAEHLELSTASDMVVLVIDPRAARELQTTIAAGQPAALRHATDPDTPTAFVVPVDRPELPVRDPRHGWAIPVDAAAREGIGKLAPGPQEVEISPQLGLVIEEPPRP